MSLLMRRGTNNRYIRTAASEILLLLALTNTSILLCSDLQQTPMSLFKHMNNSVKDEKRPFVSILFELQIRLIALFGFLC
jgi:hypothetical protein